MTSQNLSLRKMILFSLIFVPISVSFGARPSRSVMTAGYYVDAGKVDGGFVAANRWGIELFEVGDEGNLISVARAHTCGRAEFLDIKGDLVAVSNMNGSVEFFRMEGARFVPAGLLRLDFHPLELKIAGNFLYIGGAERSLVTYDITDPSHPRYISETLFTGYPHDFKIRNDTMFVAAYRGGVVILDISDRGAPEVLEQYFMPDFVYGVEIDSSYLYVCAHQAGLYVLDLRFNGRPPVIGHCSDFGSARKAALVDGGLLVLDTFGYMKLVDLARRSVPEIIWSMPLEFNCYDMKISEDLVFLANWIYGVKTIRLNGKGEPYPVSTESRNALCKSLVVDRGRVLVAAGKGGLMAFDRDLKPVEVPDLNLDGGCLEIKTDGNLGFLSNDECGIEILNLKNNGEIEIASRLKTEGWVKSCAYSGQYAFLANWQGIVTVDLLDIDLPVVDGFCDTDFGSSRVEFRNDTVFVAGSGGLELYDASDPRHVTFLDRYYTVYPSYNLSFYGNLAVLAAGLGGVDFVGLSDGLPAIAHIPAAGRAYDARIIESRLFVAEADSGVTAWDVTNIDNPQYLLRFDCAGKAYALAFEGNRMYAADYYGVTMFELPWEDIYDGDDPDPGPYKATRVALYPNPIVAKSSLNMDLESPGIVTVELYDILGRKIRTLYDGYSSGNRALNWPDMALPSGRYYVRVKGEGFSETRAVTLLK